MSLKPGASAARLDEAEEALGLALPEVARLWWGARDWQLGQWIGHDLRAMPLDDAVNDYHRLRRFAAELAEDPSTPPELASVGVWWSSTWLPLLDTGGRPNVALDCSSGAVIQPDAEQVGDEDYPAPLAPSIAALLQAAIEELEEVDYTYDADHRRWTWPGEFPTRRDRP